jgi:hypothetical protein
MPTESLPWAQAVQPINGTHGNIVPPKEGTTVVGFFMDGKEAQIPIMTGIMNGVPSTKVPSSKGFSDPGTDLSSRPKPPGKSPTTYPAKVNQPMTPGLALNEFISGTDSYLQFKDLTKVSVTTATAFIPDVEKIAKSFTLPTLSSLSESLDIPDFSEITGAIDGFVGDIQGAVDDIISEVTGELEGITSKLSDALSSVQEITDKIEGQLENLVGELESVAGTAVEGAIGDLKKGVEGTLSNLSKTISGEISGTDSLTSLLGDAGNDILEEAKSVFGEANLNTDMVSSLVDLKLASIIEPKSTPTWEEPASPYNAQYPYNTVTQTESGHVVEIDDTPGAERIHTRHRTGTYDEMQPDGSRVSHIFGNGFHIVAKDQNVTISGVCNITVNGDANFYVKKNLRSVVEGDAVMEFKKNLKMVVNENFIIEGNKDFVQKIKQNIFVDNGKDFIHGSGAKQTWSSSGDQNWSSAGNQNWSANKYDYK